MMHELVEGFLAFARLSENAGSDRVSDVLQAVGRLWIPEAAKAGRELVFRQEDCCPGSFSPLLLSTVVSNLVKNALAYSHEGEIEVTETSTGIVVADHGRPYSSRGAEADFRTFCPGKDECGYRTDGLWSGTVHRLAHLYAHGLAGESCFGSRWQRLHRNVVSPADAAESARRSDELG